MTAVVIALPEPHARRLADELEAEGIDVLAVVPASAVLPLPRGADAVLITATRKSLTPLLLAACDRTGARVIPVGESDDRLLSRYGLQRSLPLDAAGWEISAALAVDAPAALGRATARSPRITTVWGPHGSPGRSTVAIQLAVELTRAGRHTALLDADTVAPSLSLLLGLNDDAPGIAAACRRAELGALDAAELTRVATTMGTSAGEIEVLGGINRPNRWPEISDIRLRTTLQACRAWVDDTVVDVAAAFDADEEATYDLLGPRRHAATVAAITEADSIVALASADPLGISRFVREYVELRRLAATTPIRVVVNQVRPGPLGIDARGQIRRTLERFAGVTDVVFLPFDQRATDAGLLHARPLADIAPRSTLVAGIRRLASTMAPVTDGSSRGSSPAARRLLPARVAREV